jgi:hypothetical protein
VRLLFSVIAGCALSTLVFGADPLASLQGKIDRITSGKLKPGARVELTPGELLAFGVQQAPPGVRNGRLTIPAPQRATGSALVDFARVGRAQGWQPNPLLAWLLDGERQVSATVRIDSSGGRATVTPTSVSISGVTLDGATLDFVIKNLLLRLYPSAAIGRPFDLGYNIDHLDIQPAGVGIVIGP